MHDVPLLHPLSGRQSPSAAASPAGLSHTAVSVGHLQSSLAITLSKLWSRFLCERRSDCSCIAARDLSFSSSEGPDSEVTHASTSVWAAGPVPAAGGWFTSSKPPRQCKLLASQCLSIQTAPAPCQPLRQCRTRRRVSSSPAVSTDTRPVCTCQHDR
ncbi:hypothetical protein C0Q70_06544 [Pomacea canaliculata]|uniref:Uncharacterized protein n=1 Tax=Pomacea canaliculata TaxID=400727 RepID=A0A2T7PPA9_POMCA|nr:hypothetical protein C0Q70_06544 [Pomacea canaliculata]